VWKLLQFLYELQAAKAAVDLLRPEAVVKVAEDLFAGSSRAIP
jgi:hypothetical protein